MCRSDACMCAAECVRDSLRDEDTMCRRVSDWTCARLREYGKWELLPVEDKLMVDIQPQREP